MWLSHCCVNEKKVVIRWMVIGSCGGNDNSDMVLNEV